MPNAATLKSVFKSYGTRTILKDLTTELPEGRFIVLLGRNGAGKSTFLRALVGLEGIDRGDIALFGSNLEDEDLERRRAVSYISELIVMPHTLKTAAKITREIYPSWDESVYQKFVKIFGMNEAQHFLALSRGQRIQFLFALATATRPRLYILDEVTSVLDAHARFETMKYLKEEVARGATAVLATNIATETHGLADYVVFLNEGKIDLGSTVEDLRDQFQKFRIPADHPDTAIALSSGARAIHTNPDGTISYVLRSSAPAIMKEEWRDRRAITIEDLFIYLTGPGEG